MGSGEGLVPRVAQDVMPGQIKLDSVFRLYTRWRELGLPGTFKFTYVSNEELAHPPAGAGLSAPCQAPPGTTSEHFNPPFEACLFAIGRYKGAAGQWDFSDAHARGCGERRSLGAPARGPYRLMAARSAISPAGPADAGSSPMRVRKVHMVSRWYSV